MAKSQDILRLERNAKTKNAVFKTVVYIFLIFWGLVVLFPFYWMILSSIKSYASYMSERLPKFYA